MHPTMKADYKLGNFTGWYSSDCLYGLYSGKRYEKNTPVNIEYDYGDDYIQISFKASYEKSLFVYNIIIWIMMIGMKNMKNVF